MGWLSLKVAGYFTDLTWLTRATVIHCFVCLIISMISLLVPVFDTDLIPQYLREYN